MGAGRGEGIGGGLVGAGRGEGVGGGLVRAGRGEGVGRLVGCGQGEDGCEGDPDVRDDGPPRPKGRREGPGFSSGA